MTKSILLIICLLPLSLMTVRAQTDPGPVRRPVVVKLNPLAALGPDGMLPVALELPVGGRGAVQAELGYGPFGSLMNMDPEVYVRQKTVRVRLDYRVYAQGYTPTDPGGYWAVEGLYKRTDVQENQTIGRDCVGGQCGYFQTVPQPVTRYVIGAYLKGGRIFALENRRGRAGRFAVDVGVRVGLRHAWVVRDPVVLPFFSQYAGRDYPFTNWPRLFEYDRFQLTGREPFALPDIQVGATLAYRLW
jgi:hypothetical protein